MNWIWLSLLQRDEREGWKHRQPATAVRKLKLDWWHSGTSCRLPWSLFFITSIFAHAARSSLFPFVGAQSWSVFIKHLKDQFKPFASKCLFTFQNVICVLAAAYCLEVKSTHKGGNQRSKDVTRTQQQGPESPTVTLTWLALTSHKVR